MQHTVALTPVRTGTPAGGASRSRRRTRSTAHVWILQHQTALATGTVVALIIAAIVVAILSLLVQPSSPQPSGWAQVTVEPHASLWALATAHPVAGLSTSETATLIAEENGLASGVIHPGQTLRVPSSGLAQTAVALR